MLKKSNIKNLINIKIYFELYHIYSLIINMFIYRYCYIHIYYYSWVLYYYFYTILAKKYIIFYKKKKLKKNFFFYKKIKKIQKIIKYKHYKISKYKFVNIISNSINYNKNAQNIFLVQRIPPSRSIFNKFFVKFYYKNFKHLNLTSKLIKNKVQSLYVVNISRSSISLFRGARRFQWSLYAKGSMRRDRYNKFLPKFLYTEKNINDFSKFIKFLYFYNKFFYWKFIKLNKNFKLLHIFFNLKKDIITLPINLHGNKLFNFYKFKHRKIFNKAKKWSYLRFLHYTTPWMNYKRKIPKFLQNINPKFYCLLKNYHVDRLIGVIGILSYKKLQLTDPLEFLKLPQTIQLYKFRYRV